MPDRSAQTPTSDRAAQHAGGTRSPTRAATARAHPHHETMLVLQRAAGNQAVTALLAGPYLPVQRNGFFSSLRAKLPGGKPKAPKPPKATHEKKAAHEMTSAEGLQEMARVATEIEKCVERKKKLEGEEGVSPEQAAKEVYGTAPADVKRYLPLHTEFDVVKRQIDKARMEEGGSKHGEVAERLAEKAEMYGYKPGMGDPVEASPKDIEKDLKDDRAYRRQLERMAQRRLAGEREAAEIALETAQKSGNQDAIAAAQRKLDKLKGSGGFEDVLLGLEVETQLAVERRTAKKIEKRKATLKVDVLSEAELWRMREKAKAEVRDELEGGLDPRLIDAGKGVGIAGKVGAKAAKGAGKLGKPLAEKNLNKEGLGLFNGTVKSIGQGLKSAGGLFSDAVKLAGKVADVKAGKGDKHSQLEITAAALKVVKQAAASARRSMKAAQAFNEVLDKDPGLAAAVPGVGIVTAAIGFVGNAVEMVPPAERLHNTVASRQAAEKENKNPLVAALKRTVVENTLQLTTQLTGAIANLMRITASIVELCTAGGMGAPAAIKGASYVLVAAKKVADVVTLDVYAAKTQTARKEGALQVEGSGEKLISTDITYAVDTILLAARTALEHRAAGLPLSEAEQHLISLLDAYGMTADEAARLSLGEMHTKMLDKLDQDDEQATLKMKVKEGLAKAKKTLKDLASDDKKDKGYKDLDTYAKEEKAKAAAEAEKTTGDKVKEGLKTAAGYGKKIVKAPLKVKKIGEIASEKAEKVKRLREIKNELNYKDRSDRGRGFAAKEFGADLDESIRKLRKWIVATQPPDVASVYLKELNTLSEQEAMGGKAKEKAEAEERSQEPVSDRVISPELSAQAPHMSTAEIIALLGTPGLGKADREYLKSILQGRAA